MQQAKVTVKGQITIPKAIRDALDIHEGDSITFEIEGNQAVIKPLKRKPLVDFFGTFPAKRPYPGLERIRQEVQRKGGNGLAERKRS
jgi:AbrB family looped-hinge helix DNA binding protein